MSVQASPKTPEHENEAVPYELLEKFLDIQQEEVKQKALETQIAAQNADNNFKYAMHAADLQSQDSAHDRELKLALRKTSLSYGVAFAALTVIVISVAMWLDKEQFVVELVKVLIYGGGGMLIGNFYQKAKQRERDTEDE